MPAQRTTRRHLVRSGRVSNIINDSVGWLPDLVTKILDLGDPVRPEETFFALGATSRQIVELQARISAEIGCEFPLRMIFSYPNVTELAECVSAVRTAHSGTDSPFIPLTSFAADAPTILLAHTQGGEIVDYAGFARALHDSSANLIGLEEPGLTNGGHHIHSIEEVAAVYLAEIERRSLRVDMIVGYSFGALVAFQLAKSMRGRPGHQPMLCLIDPAPPATSGPHLGNDPLEYWIWHYGEVADVNIDDLRRYPSSDDMVDHIISRLRVRGTLAPRFTWASPGRARELMRALHACLAARWQFRPSRADMDATIYLTTGDVRGQQNPAAELSSRAGVWHEVFGGQIHIFQIDGDHNSCMMGSNSEKLAKHVVGLLDNSAAESDPDKIKDQGVFRRFPG